MKNLETIISFLPNYLICIDKYNEGRIEGRIYSGYKRFNDIKFRDVYEVILKIDTIMDVIKCPRSSVNKRNLMNKKKAILLDESEIKEAKRKMRRFDTASETGEKATFILQIKFRQNASWQGTIQWVEKKRTLNFRSALELIKIIDSVCEEGYQAEVIGLEEGII